MDLLRKGKELKRSDSVKYVLSAASQILIRRRENKGAVLVKWKGEKQLSQEIEEKVKSEQDNEIIPKKRYTGQKKQQQNAINSTFAPTKCPTEP